MTEPGIFWVTQKLLKADMGGVWGWDSGWVEGQNAKKKLESVLFYSTDRCKKPEITKLGLNF